jgi:hypothetical protein
MFQTGRTLCILISILSDDRVFTITGQSSNSS